MAWVVFMVFDWSGRNGDVWEIKRRISLEEVQRTGPVADEAHESRVPL
jgi:hypothetical protein